MLISLCALAWSQEAPPVVNGDTTSGYDEALLLYAEDSSSGYGAVCTGSLVADEWVLTAAHCVVDSTGFNITDIYVLVGSSMRNYTQAVMADDWTPHEDYNGRDIYNDVAMIHLSDTFSGVPLMGVNKDSFQNGWVGDDFRVVGFGMTSDNDNSTNSTKRYADIPLYDYDGSLAVYYDEPDQQNACHGDSGGPVLRLLDDGNYEVAGVVNTAYPFEGNDCEQNGFTALRVDAYVDWIEEFTPVYSWEELYGDGEDPDPDTGDDPDPDPDDTADPDDPDEDTEAFVDEDPVRPDEVGEDYDSVTLGSGCGCTTGGAGAPGLLTALGALLWVRRRR